MKTQKLNGLERTFLLKFGDKAGPQGRHAMGLCSCTAHLPRLLRGSPAANVYPGNNRVAAIYLHNVIIHVVYYNIM